MYDTFRTINENKAFYSQYLILKNNKYILWQYL
ncbi:MAG: hypothetical protein BWY27_01416 [Bacteroidetes bacterium ADurb.Bin234]|nr:MAG: hypothetical protein BWY27_01416 [Bacteroidetes bacterium ADurb.Bin234]